MMFIRKGMDYIFTQREMWALDDILPQWRLLFCPPEAEEEEKEEIESVLEHPELNGTVSNEIDEIEEENEDEEDTSSIQFTAGKGKDRETVL